MIRTYFEFAIGKFLVGLIILLIISAIVIIWALISCIKDRIIEKFFLSNGYERKLFGVPSVGPGAFYGWVRESDGKRVDDRDIKGWSLRQIMKEYK